MNSADPTMSIWYISKYLVAPSPSREGNRGFQLMRELAKLGHRVSVITSDSIQHTDIPTLQNRFTLEQVDGIDLYRVRTLKFTKAKSFRRILSWLHFEWGVLRLPLRRFFPPDIIIASSLSLFSVLTGAMLRRRFGSRLVFEVRDIWPLTIIEEGGFRRLNPFVYLLGLIERFGYRNADMIVGTMPGLSDHVFAQIGERRNVYCIPMGYAGNPCDATQHLPAAYIAAQVPKGRFLVGYVGSVGISNALDVMFKCAELMRDCNDVHFVVVGDGDLRQGYIDHFDVLPNVTFVDKVPKDSVQAVLKQFDLLYFSVHDSAVWRYGQSLNKVLDYMLSGKPIVGSYSGYPSMINEANCGTFVPAGDVEELAAEIERLKSIDAEQRLIMGARGQRWVLDHRSYECLALKYAELLATLQPAGIES